jgi:hypothetical protein
MARPGFEPGTPRLHLQGFLIVLRRWRASGFFRTLRPFPRRKGRRRGSSAFSPPAVTRAIAADGVARSPARSSPPRASVVRCRCELLLVLRSSFPAARTTDACAARSPQRRGERDVAGSLALIGSGSGYGRDCPNLTTCRLAPAPRAPSSSASRCATSVSGRPRVWRAAGDLRFWPSDLSENRSRTAGRSRVGRGGVPADGEKQGNRLDGRAVVRVDDAPSCEFGDEQV